MMIPPIHKLRIWMFGGFDSRQVLDLRGGIPGSKGKLPRNIDSATFCLRILSLWIDHTPLPPGKLTCRHYAPTDGRKTKSSNSKSQQACDIGH